MATFIHKREKEDNAYKRLQDHTLKRIEQLCGKVWTDYNAHDPGITIADYFNYALYELNYRLSFSVETYLLEQEQREIQFDRKGMLPREELFNKAIVTKRDYEKLFRSKFPELEKCLIILNDVTGHYDIFIKIHNEKNISEEDIQQLKQKIRKTYHQHRNLCENLKEIKLFQEKQSEDHQYRTRDFRRSNKKYEAPSFFEDVAYKTTELQAFTKEYHSIQFDFPENYRIGEQGIPFYASQEEKGKVMQLKGYLLIIDLLLADTLQQVDQVKTMLDFSGKIPVSPLHMVDIPEKELLINQDALKNFRLHSDIYYNSQKSHYLDLLDAFYGEDTKSYFREEQTVASVETNERRAKFIHQLPQLNANRFRAFNINDSKSEPVIQYVVNQLTGNRYQNSTTDTFSKYGLRIISDEEFSEKYKFLKNFAFGLEIDDATFLSDIEKIKVDYNDQSFYELRKCINILWYNVLFESFLKYADKTEYYKILSLPEKEYLLVFRHPEREEWINMGLFFKNIQYLTRIANLFWEFMRKIKHKEGNYDFYYIEHIFLKPITVHDHSALSIITSAEGKTQKDREYIEKLLLERLPAHLTVNIYYVPREQMNRAEHLYHDWRLVLEAEKEDDIERTSSGLKDFLTRNKNLYAKLIN